MSPTPSAPLVAADVGLLGQVDVRAQRDAHAVGRDRVERREVAQLRFLDRLLSRALAVRVDLEVRRVDRERDRWTRRGSPSRARSDCCVAVRRPTTAGSPSDRARIATCDVRVPASVAIAMIASRSSCTVRLGVRSCVTRIAFAPLGRSTGSWSGRSSSSDSTRICTSVRSPTRSRSIAMRRRARSARATRASRSRTPFRRRGSAGSAPRPGDQLSVVEDRRCTSKIAASCDPAVRSTRSRIAASRSFAQRARLVESRDLARNRVVGNDALRHVGHLPPQEVHGADDDAR